MLGLNDSVTWKQDAKGLVIQPPAKRPCLYAYTLKITLKQGAGN
jgi:hypothetical protein